MPFLRSETLGLAILILAVPLQIFIVSYYGNTSSQSEYELERLITQVSRLKAKYIESCNVWISDLWTKVLKISPFDKPIVQSKRRELKVADYSKKKFMEIINSLSVQGKGEKSEDQEDFEDNDSNEENYFGLSHNIRSPRPPFVKYRVGQVVKHKKSGFRGVIIGWDEKAYGPEAILKEVLGAKQSYRDQPNYAVLIDSRDRLVSDFAYIPQENIVVIKSIHIIHSDLYKFFEYQDGNEYSLRPWFREIYPHD